jgi:hypothetical protein
MRSDDERSKINEAEITLATVRRIMELGEILTSVLTPNEIKELEEIYEQRRYAEH